MSTDSASQAQPAKPANPAKPAQPAQTAQTDVWLYGFRFNADTYVTVDRKKVQIRHYMFAEPHDKLPDKFSLSKAEHAVVQQLFDLHNQTDLTDQVWQLVQQTAKTNPSLVTEMIAISDFLKMYDLCKRIAEAFVDLVKQNIWPSNAGLRTNMYSQITTMHNQSLLSLELLCDAMILLMQSFSPESEHYWCYFYSCQSALKSAINHQDTNLAKQKLGLESCKLFNHETYGETSTALFVGWLDQTKQTKQTNQTNRIGGFLASYDKLHEHYDEHYCLKNCDFVIDVPAQPVGQTAEPAETAKTAIQIAASPDHAHILVVVGHTCKHVALLKVKHTVLSKYKCKPTGITVEHVFEECSHAFWVGRQHFCLLTKMLLTNNNECIYMRTIYDAATMQVVEAQPAHSVSASRKHVLWVWCEDHNAYTWSVQVGQKRVLLPELTGWLVYASAWQYGDANQFVLCARNESTTQMWLFDTTNNSLGLLDA